MPQLSPNLDWSLANPRWASILNPILKIPMLSGLSVQNIELAANSPKAINHRLQRMPQGWFLIDNTENSRIWRTEPFNPLTLTLESNADTVISIWVF